MAAAWLLSCGHSVPMLEHDKPDDPPRRPRMCPTCGKPRNVEGIDPPEVDLAKLVEQLKPGLDYLRDK